MTKFTPLTVAVLLAMLLSLSGIWICIQSSAVYMEKPLGFSSLEISLLLLLGSTIIGTATLLWSTRAETYLCRFWTGMSALMGSWCCQTYWHWSVQCCPVFAVIFVVWYSWNLWDYRNTKDSRSLKWTVITFTAMFTLITVAAAIDLSMRPGHLEIYQGNYYLAVVEAIVVVFFVV